MKITEVIILAGPLGSGKTTTLNEILRTVPASQKVGVIINDAGYIGTDSQRILPGYETGSIPGCICCESSGGLSALLEQEKGRYDVVFIEGTGGANAANLVEEVLRHSQYYTISGIIATVPVDHYDAVSQTVSFNTALDISNIVRLTWQNSVIQPSLGKRLNEKVVFRDSISYDDLIKNRWIPIVESAHEDEHPHDEEGQHGHDHRPHDHLQAYVIPIARDTNVKQMVESLQLLSEAGIERAKGFLPDGRTFDIVHGNISYQESVGGALPYVMIISSKGKIDEGIIRQFDGMRAPAWQQSQFFSPNITYENALRAFEYAYGKAQAEHYIQWGQTSIRTNFEGADTAFRMGYEILAIFQDANPLNRALNEYARLRLEGLEELNNNLLLENLEYNGAVLSSYLCQLLATKSPAKLGGYPFGSPDPVFLGEHLESQVADEIRKKVVPEFFKYMAGMDSESLHLTVNEGMAGFFADVAAAVIYGNHVVGKERQAILSLTRIIAGNYRTIGSEEIAGKWYSYGDANA